MNVRFNQSANVDGNIIVRKNDFDQFPHTVLLLNGLHQTRSMWEVLEGRLRRFNFGVCSLNLSKIYEEHHFATLETQSHWLNKKLTRLFNKYDLENIHIVGSSTGGLVARHMIQQLDQGQRVRSLCTLATPHNSSVLGLVNTLVDGTTLGHWRLPNLPTASFVKRLQSHPFPVNVPFTSIVGSQDWLTPWWTAVIREPHHPRITNIRLKSVRNQDLSSDSQAFDAIKSHLNQSISEAN